MRFYVTVLWGRINLAAGQAYPQAVWHIARQISVGGRGGVSEGQAAEGGCIEGIDPVADPKTGRSSVLRNGLEHVGKL